ncbi:MAG: hypothetical protein HDT40_10190 [Lachnospiraceae bacterium]|nr:hypothetical protein [Lachnospiraceae bacterium]
MVEKRINIYKVAGKVGKGVKKYGGYVLVAGWIWITNRSNIIGKIKK